MTLDQPGKQKGNCAQAKRPREVRKDPFYTMQRHLYQKGNKKTKRSEKKSCIYNKNAHQQFLYHLHIAALQQPTNITDVYSTSLTLLQAHSSISASVKMCILQEPGCAGRSSLLFPLPSIVMTSCMVGLSSATSWMHKSAIWMHLITSISGYSSPSESSTSSSHLCSLHNCHAYYRNRLFVKNRYLLHSFQA